MSTGNTYMFFFLVELLAVLNYFNSMTSSVTEDTNNDLVQYLL